VILKSPLPDVEIPDLPLTPFVLRHAERLAEKVAIVDAGSGRSLTYAELARDIRRLAAGLRARGLRKGDVVAIVAPNLVEYPVAFHGAASAGLAVTTLNPAYTAEEISYQLRDSGARLVFTVAALLDKVREAARDTAVGEIAVFDHAPEATAFNSLLRDDAVPEVAIEPVTDLVALPYSSGTTGFSKGVMLTHRNLVANIVQSAGVLQIAEDEVGCAFLPFFHIYGMNVIMNPCLYQGATIVTMPRFDLEGFLGAVEQYRMTRLFLVPPIVLLLAKSPAVEGRDLSSVRVMMSGAAPLDGAVARACAERVGGRLVQGYGLTETAPITHLVPADTPEIDPYSVGPLVANTECKLVEPGTGVEVGPGEDGELWIRGPQVMRGYLGNEAATAASIDADGFFHTGDIGHVDERGQWYIVDRVKELIKYKGFQVPPAELEAHLVAHPAVADCAVIGVHDEEGEEIPKAFVVLKGEASAEDLMAFVAGRVAGYKRIRRLEFLDEIPKSPTGKILRRLLRDRERAASAQTAAG
jgi:acyl-CoA synthetase (AMP-forming)/AMP-acid ligase II